MQAVQLFSEGSLRMHLASQLDTATSSVQSVKDSDALGRDREEWIDSLYQQLHLTPPRMREESQPVIEDLGRQVRDVTARGGITYTLSEMGQVQRETLNYSVTLPFDGDTSLLRYAPDAGAAYVAAFVDRHGVRMEFNYVLGSESPDLFERELREWRGLVESGAAKVAEQVERFNASLPDQVGGIVDKQLAKIEASSAFTAALPFPVQRRDDAPPKVSQPPVQAIRRDVPRSGTVPADQPTLGRVYDEIIAVLGSAMRSLERHPGKFGEWDEESLRDVLLLFLNAQFEGAAHGEAFNAKGHTDLLIRVEGENLFIGECKIWHGPSEFDKAIDQLLGYTTWRDSRLALILFVKTKDVAQTAGRARATLEARPEFEHWLVGSDRARAKIRWVDDRARTATVALLVSHLHTATSSA
jgi:hypothetical protein